MNLNPLSQDYIIFDKADFQRFLSALVDKIPPTSRGHKLSLMISADDIANEYCLDYNMQTLIQMRKALKQNEA